VLAKHVAVLDPDGLFAKKMSEEETDSQSLSPKSTTRDKVFFDCIKNVK